MTPPFSPPDSSEVEIAAPEVETAQLQLSEYWAIVKKRRRLVALCGAVALLIGFIVCMTTKKMYQASVLLDIDRERAGLLDASSQERFGFDTAYISTQMQLMRSREIAERVVKRLKAQGQKRSVGPGEVRGYVDVKPVPGTNILRLSYEARDPQLAADVANAVAEAYIDWNVETKFNVVGAASEFLKTQIESLKQELDVKQQQLLAYGRQKDIISSDPSANAPLQNLESLNRDYASAVADRIAKEARYHEMRTARPESIADTLSNGVVTGLRSELSRYERDYAEKLNLYKPEWPAMKQLQVQIDKSREHLDAVVQETVSKARDLAKNDYETAVRRESSLKGVLAPQRQEVMTASSNAVQYNDLRLQVEAKRQQLDSLLKQEAQMELTSRLRGARVSNARIIDRAEPDPTPFKPNFKRTLPLSAFAGFVVGIGLAIFLAYMDRTLRSVEDVTRHLHLPALGVIPSIRTGLRGYYGKGGRKGTGEAGEELVIERLPHLQPRSAVAESYRAFRAALLLSRAGGLKSLMITSCLPGEGKSSTAVNLAIVLGQLGKRVVLIDADLHRPRLHEIFHISNRVGLVSVLAEDLDATRAIITTDMPGVFLVPSGPATPNPSGLLASDAMTKFLELAALNFDYVIIDAPPVAPVADALVIGNQIDGAVLCVRGAKTPRDQVARVRDKLLWANVRILGVLISNLPEGSGDGYEAAYLYEDVYQDTAPVKEPEKRLVGASRRV